MVDFIEDTEFKQLASIGHAFFTRKGGVSEGVYQSLNCSYLGLDDPQKITENRRRAMAHLNFPLEALVTVTCVHGNRVIVVDDLSVDYLKLEADALVSKLKNIVLASDTADCPVVLFADEEAEVIGVAHAGWKGAKAGVIEATIDKMLSLGARHQNIAAVISPCITQEYYEVSLEFYQDFLAMTEINSRYFVPSVKDGHFMFDLLAYNKDKLLNHQLKSVSVAGISTYANEEQFFSCRRSFHQGKLEFGCQLACVYFRAEADFV